MTEENKGEEAYSKDAFWQKIKNLAMRAGKGIIERALQLFYAAKKPETPGWAKAVIYGALGYFISPIDAIPDIIPIVGFVDDLGVLALAIGTVAMHIDQDVKDKASEKLKRWFGE